MTTTAPALHPNSVAALLRTAEAHESAAAVLRRRNPAAAEVHASLATRVRTKLR